MSNDTSEKNEVSHLEHGEGHHTEKELIALASANVDEGKLKLTAATWLACFFGAFNVFTQLVALTGPGNIISFLTSDLGNPGLGVWIIQTPTIVQAALTPFAGRLADEIGRKYLVCGAPIFGIIGAIIASQATSMEMLIGASATMGVAQITVGICCAIPSEVLPSRLRAVSQSFIQIAGSSAAAVAALGTGGFVQGNPSGWRNFYYLVAGLMFLSVIGPYFFYNPPPRVGQLKPWREILKHCDYVGTLLVGTSTTLIILGINFGALRGYTNPLFIAPLILGLAAAAVTGLHQYKFKKDGIFHHELFTYAKRNFIVCCVIMFIEGWLYFSAVAAYYPLRYLGFATEPFQIGLRKFWFNITQFCMIVPIILIVTYTKNVKWLLCFAFCMYLTSMAIFSTLRPNDGNLSIGAVILAGIGMTPQLILVTMTIQLASPPALIATAGSVGLTIRGIGGAFGSAVMGSQITQRMGANLAPAIVPVATSLGLPQTSAGALVAAFRSAAEPAIRAVPGISQAIIDAVRPITRETYASAFKWAYITSIPPAALGAIVILLLDSNKIKARMSRKIDATAEHIKVEDTEDIQELEEKDIKANGAPAAELLSKH